MAKTIVEEHSLTSYVSMLRKILGDEGETARYIETVRGRGYRFVARVTRGTSESRRRASVWRWPWVSGLITAAIVCGALIWFFGFRGMPGVPDSTPVVAVLPFENLSTDPGNAYFAAGIQDTILSKLAGIGALRVISRTSTERYPSHPANLKQISTELGATAIMEGSVQKAGDQVLINVQLIDTETNEHLWAHVYTRSLADVFAVENDVATQVAAALKAKLLPREAARIEHAPTRDPQAYLLYLKANFYANQIMRSSNAKDSVTTFNQAVSLYHQALAKDPRFALAYARLSLLESYSEQFNIARKPKATKNAEHAAMQALALEPDLPAAHLALGYAKYYGHQNYSGALSQFKRIPERIRRHNADVVGAIAFIHRRQGKWQEAIIGLRRAAKLDPRNPRWFYGLGLTLGALRRYPESVQQFDRALAIEPSDYSAAAFKAMALLSAGEPLPKVQQALRNIPLNSSQQGLIAALHFEIALMSRQPQAALDALGDAPNWIAAPNAVGQEPTALLRAHGRAESGDIPAARQAYQQACDSLKKAQQTRPNAAYLWSFLGLAEAGLGQKSEAIQAGLKATSLTPVSEDVVAGPSHLVTLAEIYAKLGESGKAIKLLRRLLAMPSGLFISVPLLERDPIWDPLRQNLEFQNLLKQYNEVPHQ